MILCIGDDLTGIAELAGQAADYGIRGLLQARLTVSIKQRGMGWGAQAPQIIYLNLGCRTLSNNQARDRLIEVLQLFDCDRIDHLYLKVDSVGRGPIRGLLEALRMRFEAEKIPLLLGNPRQLRTVQNGNLYVGDQPLHRSAFSQDPLHPTLQSSIFEMLQGIEGSEVLREDELERPGKPVIRCLDCRTLGDVEKHAECWSSSRVAVGAAPFGVELLCCWLKPGRIEKKREHGHLVFVRTFAVIGTRNPAGDALEEGFIHRGGAVAHSGESTTADLPLMLRVPSTMTDPGIALQRLTEDACALMKRLDPVNLFVAGGETAQSLLKDLDIEFLEPVSFAHQVAELRLPDPDPGMLQVLLVTPGSYCDRDVWTKIFRH